METKQLNCPNCGAQVNSSNSRELECSYCGSKFKNPLYEEKPKKEKRGIEERDLRIPFQSSPEDVKDALYNKFISNDEVPLDIFDKLEIVSMKRYYLPMYYFSGRYDAPWSCTKVIKRRDNHGNEYTDYQPASGLTRGNFSKLVLASRGLGLPGDLQKYAHVLSLTPGLNSRKSSVSQSVGTNIEVLSLDRTRDECWDDGFFHDQINSSARGAAWDDAIGWQAENFSCSTSFVCDRSELLYIPIWYGLYSYKGQEYYFAMDDQLGNIDFAYSRDNTDEKRRTRIWLRFIFTLIALAAIVIFTECAPAFLVALLGAIFLFFRSAFEYSKSSDDLSSIKKIGKAKLCNEEIPESSQDYYRYKRTNQIMTCILIAIVALWGFGSMALREQKEMAEKAGFALEESKEQQEEVLIDMSDEGTDDTDVAAEEQVQEETSSAVEETVDAAADEYTSSDNMWLAQRYASKEDIAGLSSDEIRILRNSIFARHGRYFKDPELQAYFNSQSWYSPYRKEVPIQELNEYEKKNIEFLKKHE